MPQPNATLIYYNQKNPTLVDPRFDMLKEPEDLIEYAGRWDYGENSIAKFGKDPTIVGRWIDGGEESMVEMGDATVFIECSRVVSHEIVRHRIASYQQESQRFVNYKDETVDSLFILPPELDNEDDRAQFWNACSVSLDTYRSFIADGGKKQIARYVLPNATRTRLIMKANFREWRHYLKLRCHTSAQPEMRDIAWQIHDQLLDKFPKSFGGIKPFLESGERQAR